jgi:hypothetical protein
LVREKIRFKEQKYTQLTGLLLVVGKLEIIQQLSRKLFEQANWVLSIPQEKKLIYPQL